MGQLVAVQLTVPSVPHGASRLVIEFRLEQSQGLPVGIRPVVAFFVGWHQGSWCPRRRKRWRMVIERASSNSSVIDVLDRVLDKGIVIDAWVRVSLVGIDLVTVEARVVVASIATYFSHADAIAELPRASPAGPLLPPPQTSPKTITST